MKTKKEVNGNTLEPVELNNQALSLLKDEDNNDYVIVKVNFDYKTKKTSESEVIFRDRSFSLTKERFIVLMGKLFL